ncbi:HAD-IA family hydrolase [Paenibacillus sp. H1-7]|uniref:HAD family hydrolase n=1 Tax=Paenibacillus sp. H1-7 TaxID=2282849 RepID=UPI001EF82CEA|nr:HAD-IA family hydrolase [Paenibacillus sp. H1-7]
MNPKMIFWDFDGTLGYRRDGMWGASMLEALQKHDPDTKITAPDFKPFLTTGFPWHQPNISNPPNLSPSAWWAPILNQFARGYEHCGIEKELSLALARTAREIFIDLARWALFDDTIPTLTQLSQKGWKHAIVSNHIPELKQIVQSLQLWEHIDGFINSAEVGYEKPNPAIFNFALQMSGHPPEVWMIGDNIEADYFGAEAAGIRAILVRSEDARASRRCQCLTEVISWVEGA